MAQISSIKLEPSETELKPLTKAQRKPNQTAKLFKNGSSLNLVVADSYYIL